MLRYAKYKVLINVNTTCSVSLNRIMKRIQSSLSVSTLYCMQIVLLKPLLVCLQIVLLKIFIGVFLRGKKLTLFLQPSLKFFQQFYIYLVQLTSIKIMSDALSISKGKAKHLFFVANDI